MVTPDTASSEEITEGQKIVCYSRNSQGEYELVPEFVCQPVTVANQQAWREIDRQLARSREKVLSGRVSCLHYYMTAALMDTGLLARYTGQSRWKVRLHLVPFFFARLPADTLKKYADLFSISPDDLRTASLLPADRNHR
jgi:hypothetical protein